MLTKRIIACLDVRDGRVVKGVQFVDIVDAGDPAELARYLWATNELALIPQHEERGDHLLTDIGDRLRVRRAVVLEGLL